MPKQKQKTTTQLRGPKRSVGYLVLPALCLSALAVFLPMLLTIIVSFTDWNGVANLKELNFIGLRNFTEIFADEVFIKAFVNNVLWTTIYLSIPVCIALFAAVLLLGRKNARIAYQILFLIPYVLAPAINAMVWLYIIFNPVSGVWGFLKKLGMNVINPLSNQSIALYTVAGIDIWHYWGYLTVVYLAALRQTPQDQIEAAQVMGCNALQIFWYVYFPNIKATFRLMLIMIMITSFKSFDYVWLLTQGGPAHATEMLGTYAYKLSYSMFQTGKASAVSLVMGAFGLAMSSLYTALSRKEDPS